MILEKAQKELINVLIEYIYSLGLISKTTYLKAKDLVYATLDFPAFFYDPACLAKEDNGFECPENS